MKLKYIIVKDMGCELPVIFSDLLVHRDVARNYLHSVVGAGFVDISSTGVVCYGESYSLNVPSRGQEDTDIIREFLSL